MMLCQDCVTMCVRSCDAMSGLCDNVCKVM